MKDFKVLIANDEEMILLAIQSIFKGLLNYEVQTAVNGEEALRLVELGLPLPAYEMVMKASHTFNLLDARNAISVTERQRYILRVRTLARKTAEVYFHSRLKEGFPLAPPAIAQEVIAQHSQSPEGGSNK